MRTKPPGPSRVLRRVRRNPSTELTWVIHLFALAVRPVGLFIGQRAEPGLKHRSGRFGHGHCLLKIDFQELRLTAPLLSGPINIPKGRTAALTRPNGIGPTLDETNCHGGRLCRIPNHLLQNSAHTNRYRTRYEECSALSRPDRALIGRSGR